MRLSSDRDRKPCAIVPPNMVSGGGLGVDMDELPVLGDVGEGVDPLPGRW